MSDGRSAYQVPPPADFRGGGAAKKRHPGRRDLACQPAGGNEDDP